MKSLSLMAGGFVLLAGLFVVPAVGPVPDRNRRPETTPSPSRPRKPWTDTGVDLQAGDVLQIHSSSGGELRSGGSERCRQHRPSRGLCSRRSLDRPVAGAGSAGPGRQRQAAQGRRTRSSLLRSERVGHATLQRQLRSQGPHRSAAVPARACGRQLADRQMLSGRHFVLDCRCGARSLIDRSAKQRRRRTSSRNWPAPPRYFWRDNSAPAQRLPPLLLRRARRK